MSAPTLWRVCSYSRPGLPSPTTSQSAGVPVRAGGDPRRRSIAYSSSPGRLATLGRHGRLGAFAFGHLAFGGPRSSPSTAVTRGATTCAMSASGSRVASTPAGRGRSASRTWSPMSSSETSNSMAPGMSWGRASIGRREDELLEQAAVADAFGLAEQVHRRPRR